MKPGSQNAKVLAYLESHRHITPLEALGVFGVFRLAARVYEINKHLDETGDSRVIKTERVIDAEGKQYARYKLVNREPAALYHGLTAPRENAATTPVVMQRAA